MGRWCRTCQSRHQPPTGQQCKRTIVYTGNMAEADPANVGVIDQTENAGNILGSPNKTITQSQTVRSPPADSQKAILLELKRITSTFGAFQKQAEEDRAVLSGLVRKIHETDEINRRDTNTGIRRSETSVVTTGMVSGASNINSWLFTAGGQTVLTQERTAGQVTTTNTLDMVVNTTAARETTVPLVARSRDIPQDSGLSNPNVSAASSSGTNGTGAVVKAPGIPHYSRPSQVQSSIPEASTVQRISGSNIRRVQLADVQQSGRREADHSAVRAMVTQPVATRLEGAHSVSRPTYFLGNSHASTSNRSRTGEAVPQDDWLIQPGLDGGDDFIQDNARPIPTLQTLRQDADIQQRVQHRFHELEQLQQPDTGNLDLLIDALVKKKTEKQKIKWPQELAFVGTMRKRPSYEQLTICQWMLGFLRIQQEEKDSVVKDNMSQYLVELMQDACDFTWESAKGAHSVLLHRMTDGVLDWHNLDEIQKIRKRYAQTFGNQNQADRIKQMKTVPCIKFNKGNCSKSHDHEWQNMLLKHMCHFCFTTTGQVQQHSKRDCWKAPKDVSKN